MMKIKNKRFLNGKILMAVLIGTNVIWGAQRPMPKSSINLL